jgi:hypothetical protein
MKKTVHQALAPLMGLPLCHIGRSGNMVLLQFGELREISARDGGTHAVHEWTVQVQCPWRITQGTRIVVAYRDFYYSDVPLKNLDVMSKSRFNTVLDTLCKEFELNPPRVSSVEADDTGGFSLRLNADYRLEVFPAENTESGKHWRIFEPGILGRSFVFPPSET